MNAERFVQYVREVLVPNLGNFDLKEPHCVAIMDNCSIHIDTRVGSLIAYAAAVLLYSAPYSPDLIPIEYMFHPWQAFLKRHSTEFFNNWYEIYLLAIMSVTPEQGLNFGCKSSIVESVTRNNSSYFFDSRVIRGR